MRLRLHVPAGETERFAPGCLDAHVGKVVRFEDDSSEDCPCYVRVVGYALVDDGRALTVDVEEIDEPEVRQPAVYQAPVVSDLGKLW